MKRGNRKSGQCLVVLAILQIILLYHINLFFVEFREEMARYYQIASVLYDVLKTVTPGKHEVLYPIITSPYNMIFHLHHIFYILE